MSQNVKSLFKRAAWIFLWVSLIPWAIRAGNLLLWDFNMPATDAYIRAGYVMLTVIYMNLALRR